jgi:sensory rhodopsin
VVSLGEWKGVLWRLEKNQPSRMEASKDVKVLSDTTKNTFYTSYLVLFGYTIITLIEAIRTPSVLIRHIMNIETAISLVAGLVYGYLNEEIKKPGVDLKQITRIRYVDWSITTPLILLVILLFYNGENAIDYKTYLGIIGLNAGMLYSGYLGETGKINKMMGGVVGFLFFGAMLALFYSCCLPTKSSPIVFWIFAFIWTLYGVAYYIEEEETKNFCYNILDVSAKALFGVVLWSYYGKVLKY